MKSLSDSDVEKSIPAPDTQLHFSAAETQTQPPLSFLLRLYFLSYYFLLV